jgi:NADH dehydrogenase FAD-containing subunit
MVFKAVRFYGKIVYLVVKLALKFLSQHLQSIKHKYTWRESSSMRNVVVIGGSFSGIILAKRLARSLPTGYRVILIEKNSHFNYLFNFPRYSVVPGHEEKAFIPYDAIMKGAPPGIFKFAQDTATSFEAGKILLASGKEIPYDFLAVAIGTAQAPPANLAATEKTEGCMELRYFQSRIASAKSVAIVGGGAVGVQMAGDIKSVYPEKQVLLVHSGKQLLPRFGKKLHDYVVPVLTNMGIEVMLNQRPTGVSPTARSLQFKDGSIDEFDLVVFPLAGTLHGSPFTYNTLLDSVHRTAVAIDPVD